MSRRRSFEGADHGQPRREGGRRRLVGRQRDQAGRVEGHRQAGDHDGDGIDGDVGGPRGASAAPKQPQGTPRWPARFWAARKARKPA